MWGERQNVGHPDRDGNALLVLIRRKMTYKNIVQGLIAGPTFSKEGPGNALAIWLTYYSIMPVGLCI